MKRVHLLIVAIVLIAAGIVHLVVKNLPSRHTGQSSDRSGKDNNQTIKQDKGGVKEGPSVTSQTIAQQVSDLEIRRDIELLGKGPHAKRLEAIRRLGKRKVKEAVPILIELIDASYPNDEEREATLEAIADALGDIGDPAAIPALNKLLDFKPKVMVTRFPCRTPVEMCKYDIPFAARLAIGDINRVEKKKELEKLLQALPEKDRMDKVARLALEIDTEDLLLCRVAFHYLKKQPDAPDLILRYAEKIDKTRETTTELIRYLVDASENEKAAQALIKLADAHDGKKVLSLINGLGGIKSETAIEPLKNLAQKYPDYETAVILILGEYKRDDLIPYFIERLGKKSSGFYAADALGEIGKAVIPALRDAFTRSNDKETQLHILFAALSPEVWGVEVLPIIDLALDSPFEKVQERALIIFSSWRSWRLTIQDVIPRLMKVINSPRESIRMEALSILEMMGRGGENVQSLLEQALLSPFDDVRKGAKEALERLKSLEGTRKE